MTSVTIQLGEDGFIAKESFKDFQDLLLLYKERMRTSRVVRMQKKICPMCERSIEDYTRQVTTVTIERLHRIYRKYKDYPQGEISFTPRDIREYDNAGLSNLVHSGLLYWQKDPETGKRLKGVYGMNREIVAEFLRGQRTIPEFIWVNKMTKEREPSPGRITIKDVMTPTQIHDLLGDTFTQTRQVNELPDINLKNQSSIF